MTDAQKIPMEHPRLWLLMGATSIVILAVWATSQLSENQVPHSLWLLIAAFLFGVPSVVMPRRERRQVMEYLRRMNRGKMDLPGWEQKPWQHDEGSNKR